jgi:hypothetical protein
MACASFLCGGCAPSAIGERDADESGCRTLPAGRIITLVAAVGCSPSPAPPPLTTYRRPDAGMSWSRRDRRPRAVAATSLPMHRAGVPGPRVPAGRVDAVGVDCE